MRAAGLILLAAAATCILLAAALGHTSGAWAAWAAGAYLSWAAALTILTRRRLASAARAARRLQEPALPGRLRLTPGRALALVLLAGLIAGAAAAGATHVAAGIVAAAASTALAAARWTAELEERLGGALHLDGRELRLGG